MATDAVYAEPRRLADVMALIQVLALGKRPYRTEAGLLQSLQSPPRSAGKWTEVADDHPEFFRVQHRRDDARVSLVLRHVLPGDNDEFAELGPRYLDSLLRTAVEMHDRQVRRSQRWTYLVPVWVAMIVGSFGLIAAVLRG